MVRANGSTVRRMYRNFIEKNMFIDESMWQDLGWKEDSRYSKMKGAQIFSLSKMVTYIVYLYITAEQSQGPHELEAHGQDLIL